MPNRPSSPEPSPRAYALQTLYLGLTAGRLEQRAQGLRTAQQQSNASRLGRDAWAMGANISEQAATAQRVWPLGAIDRQLTSTQANEKLYFRTTTSLPGHIALGLVATVLWVPKLLCALIGAAVGVGVGLYEVARLHLVASEAPKTPDPVQQTALRPPRTDAVPLAPACAPTFGPPAPSSAGSSRRSSLSSSTELSASLTSQTPMSELFASYFDSLPLSPGAAQSNLRPTVDWTVFDLSCALKHRDAFTTKVSDAPVQVGQKNAPPLDKQFLLDLARANGPIVVRTPTASHRLDWFERAFSPAYAQEHADERVDMAHQTALPHLMALCDNDPLWTREVSRWATQSFWGDVLSAAQTAWKIGDKRVVMPVMALHLSKMTFEMFGPATTGAITLRGEIVWAPRLDNSLGFSELQIFEETLLPNKEPGTPRYWSIPGDAAQPEPLFISLSLLIPRPSRDKSGVVHTPKPIFASGYVGVPEAANRAR